MSKEFQITPENLINSNKSELSKSNRGIWERARENGLLILISACSDSRGIFPLQSVIIRSIAAAGDECLLKRYKNIYTDPRIAAFLQLTHFGQFELGQTPWGCGGLKAKAAGLTAENGTGNYVDRHVAHPDPFIQSLKSASVVGKILRNAAEEGANRIPKDILAAAQNHRTGDIYPVAYLDALTRSSVSSFDWHCMLDNQYNPGEIYADGIPTLPGEAIPDSISSILGKYYVDLLSLQRRHPNLEKIQESQNPELLLVTTSPKPHGTRYPELDVQKGPPGRVFVVTSPRINLDNTGVIAPSEVEDIFNQTQYPIENFDKLRVIMFETGDFGVSLETAKSAVEQPWIGEWHSKDANEIYIAEVIKGEAREIRKLCSAT